MKKSMVFVSFVVFGLVRVAGVSFHDSIGASYRDSSQPQGGECGLRTTLRAPKRLNFEVAISQPEHIYECLLYQIGV